MISVRCLAACVMALAAATCLPAHAKRGALVFNHGDELFEVGDFPPGVLVDDRMASSIKAGYKCRHVGVFWADVWTWDCHLVALLGEDRYADLPVHVVARLEGQPAFRMSQARRGLWNHYGFWSIVVAVGAVAGYGVLRRRAAGRTHGASST